MVNRINVSSFLRRSANELKVEELFQNLINTFKKDTQLLLADRDGDYFRIKCPKCKTREINKDFLVCKNGHVFTLYTEDGIIPERKENEGKILGDDLVKGKDAHGHAPYIYHDPDDKQLVFLSCWNYNEDFTMERALRLCQDLYDSLDSKGLYGFPHSMLFEANMVAGKYKPGFGWPIKSWPKPMITKKWFVLKFLLKDSPWNLRLLRYEYI